MPLSGRKLWLAGIGGAGMSGYAILSAAWGAEVSGWDRRETPYLAGVRRAGIPVEIWIDGDQQVRKLTFSIDAKQPGTSQSVKASFEVELYDYGKSLDITLPPADQVVDAATLKSS